jgi:HSP20 family protein
MAVDAMRFVSFFMQQVEAGQKTDWRPATDIYRVPGGWLVKMELAGVEPADVNLTLRGRTLVVRGRRRDCCQEADCRQLHMEISYSAFEREIELPADWNRVGLETNFRNGMLHIHLRKEAGS